MSKKHLKKSSSSSKITETANNCGLSGVRTIEIKREVQRSNSGSSCSDSSSGFGSLKNSHQENSTTTTTVNNTSVVTAPSSVKEHPTFSKLEPLNPVTKLQLLQERRKLSEHHPSFANHFGFAARYVGQRGDFPSTFNTTFNSRNNQVQRRIMMQQQQQQNSNKVAVTKSKSSSVEYSKNNQTYR